VRRYLKARLGRYSETVQHERAEDLKVLFECRPYELGWLLYAFANRIGKTVLPSGGVTGRNVDTANVSVD
jgi:hypothetical protein